MSDRLQEKDIVRGVEIQKQERLGSPLCSRNARPMKTLVGRAQLGAPQAPLLMGGDGREMERSGRTPTLLPCSRNAHPPKGLVRRPQLEQHGCSAVMNLKSYKKRGKRKESSQGALFARRTRTMKLCSFDAHSRGQPWPPLQY